MNDDSIEARSDRQLPRFVHIKKILRIEIKGKWIVLALFILITLMTVNYIRTHTVTTAGGIFESTLTNVGYIKNGTRISIPDHTNE